MLYDNHGRKIDYLRLAVTDRCNLRCQYCMPAHGLSWLSRKEVLTYEEMLRLCSVLVHMGIRKIRITGGEPFVRKDLMSFLAQLVKIPLLEKVSITTNGVLTAPYVAELYALGITSVNLSLDTLHRERFANITRRDELPNVLDTLQQLLRFNMQVKLNAVVMEGKNIEDILPLVQLTKNLPISVRFIEEMPFNGADKSFRLNWNHQQILQHIQTTYPAIKKIEDPVASTAFHYMIPGHQGTIGIIAAYSRSFCGSCNRIRVTPQGVMKTCLYEGGGLDIKTLLRSGATDDMLASALETAFKNKAANGWIAEQQRFESTGFESMASIGG